MKLDADDFPLILAGPMLRRVTSQAVAVFLALKEPRWVQLKLYDSPETFSDGTFEDNPIAGIPYPLHPTLPLGRHLHVVVATVNLPAASAGLQPGRIYGYNTFLHTTAVDTGESISLAQHDFDLLTAANAQRIGYAHQRLPSFSLPPDDLATLNIVHGSCRKPHGEGQDMLARLDDFLTRDNLYQNPDARPHLLLLTGDQIYADDVNPILLWLLHHASRALLGWEEVFPQTGQTTETLRGILQALAQEAHQVADSATGSPLPDLSGTLQDALATIQDPNVGSGLKRQLTAFGEILSALSAAAQGVVTTGIRDFAQTLSGWLNTHQAIFGALSSRHPWGQAGIPTGIPGLAATQVNENRIEELRSLLNGISVPVQEGDAAQVASALAEKLDPQAPPEIIGRFFQARLRHFFTRASQLAANPDVAALNALVDELKTWSGDETLFTYTASRISPPQRSKELQQLSGLTSDTMTAHLMFLGEFYMMYLFTWSNALWPRDASGTLRLPEFFEAVPNYALTGELSQSSLKKAREELAEFAEGVAKVRRVLANIPTLMIFDDHEVTDDWNLNLDWVASVNRSVMGPQILRNALAAYAVFQDWGNQPEDYGDDMNLAGRRILEALRMPDPTSPSGPAPDPLPPPMVDLSALNHRATVNQLFGLGPDAAAQLAQVAREALPTALVGTSDASDYALVKPEGRKRWDWAYRARANWPLKLISLDTRNHRGFPTELWAARAELPIAGFFGSGQTNGGLQTGGYVAAANLIQPAELTRQLSDRFQVGPLNLVISPAPVFGLPLVEDLFQRLSALNSGPEVADFETWQGNPDGFKRFVAALRGRDVVLLSGDVHYAYSNILTFLDGEDGVQPPIVQLCSSSMKNETNLTRLIGSLGREGRIVEWVKFAVENFPETMAVLWDELHISIQDMGENFGATLKNLLDFSAWYGETAPMLNPFNPGAYVTYYLALKDTLLLDIDTLTPRGLFAVGGGSVRYFFFDLIASDSEAGVYVQDGRSLQFLEDARDHATRLARAEQLNETAVLGALGEPEFKLKQQPEVVGFNNFGRIRFSPDTTLSPLARIRHELCWLTHDRRGKPEEVLASTIHDFTPKVLSFRRDIVRAANAELDSWNPPGEPQIKAPSPEGIALLETYCALLKSENNALQAIPPAPAPIGFDDPRGGNPEDPIRPWGATFVSYVLKIAGAGTSFFYSPRHIDYIRRAKRNRIENSDSPFRLYERSDDEALPEPGDLVVRSSAFTFAALETEDTSTDRDAQVGIVVSVSDNGITVIGGDTGDTVQGTTYTLENSGKLKAENDPFLGVIKIGRAP